MWASKSKKQRKSDELKKWASASGKGVGEIYGPSQGFQRGTEGGSVVANRV